MKCKTKASFLCLATIIVNEKDTDLMPWKVISDIEQIMTNHMADLVSFTKTKTNRLFTFAI